MGLRSDPLKKFAADYRNRALRFSATHKDLYTNISDHCRSQQGQSWTLQLQMYVNEHVWCNKPHSNHVELQVRTHGSDGGWGVQYHGEAFGLPEPLLDLQAAPVPCHAIHDGHHSLLHHLAVDEALQDQSDLLTLLCIAGAELLYLFGGKRTHGAWLMCRGSPLPPPCGWLSQRTSYQKWQRMTYD